MGRICPGDEQGRRAGRAHHRRPFPGLTDYSATVATTWSISFQQIEQDAPQAASLLGLLAFFAPDDIPIELLQTWQVLENLPGLPPDPLALDDAIAALRRYSLVERRGGMLAVHRLVQAVARDRLSDDARRAWADAAAQLVAEAFPSGENDPSDVRTWPDCARSDWISLEPGGPVFEGTRRVRPSPSRV